MTLEKPWAGQAVRLAQLFALRYTYNLAGFAKK